MFPERVFENPKHPRYGETFQVDTPTTLLAALEFENGMLGTLNISSDTYTSHAFNVGGTQGYLKLGDPNRFTDTLVLTRPGARPSEFPTPAPARGDPNDKDRQQLGEWNPEQSVELPLLHGFYESSRGVGPSGYVLRYFKWTASSLSRRYWPSRFGSYRWDSGVLQDRENL